jgi:hypothetical protein
LKAPLHRSHNILSLHLYHQISATFSIFSTITTEPLARSEFLGTSGIIQRMNCFLPLFCLNQLMIMTYHGVMCSTTKFRYMFIMVMSLSQI